MAARDADGPGDMMLPGGHLPLTSRKRPSPIRLLPSGGTMSVGTSGVGGLLTMGLDKLLGSGDALVLMICLAVVLTAWALLRSRAVRGWLGMVAGGLRRRCAAASIQALTGLAGFLAGPRHAHLREAWAADLHGDPETGELPSTTRRLRLAAGDVTGAIRCRLDDIAVLAWRPVDKLLASWHGSVLAMTAPTAIAAMMVVSREGFYGLVTNAENLTCIATASCLAIKGLRRYRQISTPKRPRKNAPSANRGH